MVRSELPPSSQEDATATRIEDHCIQPSVRGWNKMMMMMRMMMMMMMIMIMMIKLECARFFLNRYQAGMAHNGMFARQGFPP